MDEKEIIDLVKESPKVLEQVYQDLAQPSVRAVGQALGTVFEFSTSMLLPLKLLNEKFKLNFTRRLDEYRDKLMMIPEEKRCEVHPQIGTPIIEKLTYTTTDEIAELFTTLLAQASNVDRVNVAHPSFIGIIEHLSSDEARVIKYLKRKERIQYCNFNGKRKSSEGYIILLSRLTMIPEEVKLDYPMNISVYLSNLESHGIIADRYGLWVVDKTETNKICKTYHLDRLRQDYVPSRFESIDVERSYFEVTSFGKMFIDACVGM